MTDDFMLDRAENPHPRLLAGALRARDAATREGSGGATIYWHGYLDAMADATGESTDALNAWMDRAVSRDDERPEGA